MIPNNDAVLLFRFGEQQWIDREIAGHLSFSCPGNFIWQAKQTGNQVQGDMREAIFARLLKDDKRISEMQALLKKDLEIIEDGDYCLLRRRSAKLKPIYCFYAYKAKDILLDGQPEKLGKQSIRHDFSDHMYSGFADNLAIYNVVSEKSRFTQLTLQPKPFLDRIKVALSRNGYGYEMHEVDYKLFANDTFFIPPTAKYEELFYKFPEYSYQYEGRVCLVDLKFSNIFERKPVDIPPLNPKDYHKTHKPFYMISNVSINQNT